MISYTNIYHPPEILPVAVPDVTKLVTVWHVELRFAIVWLLLRSRVTPLPGFFHPGSAIVALAHARWRWWSTAEAQARWLWFRMLDDLLRLLLLLDWDNCLRLYG